MEFEPPLIAERVAPLLSTRSFGRAWRHLDSCLSTNDEAATWARAGAPHGAVVVAETQSQGRGRFGRTWHSPPSENLYFSTVARPALSPREAPPLTLATAVALAETVAAAGAVPELKWPNDLLLGGRKVAGILCEMTAAHADQVAFVIIGVGVNLNGRAFPSELADRATSVALATRATVDRARFAACLCEQLERWLDRLVADGPAPIIAAWKRFARLWGRTITVDNGRARTTGVAEDLAGDGALLLRSMDGEIHRIVAGEITGAAGGPFRA